MHFLSITKATNGILKFKTWIGCIISMTGKVQFGWEGYHGSCMHPHVAKESNPQIHEPQTATRIANDTH